MRRASISLPFLYRFFVLSLHAWNQYPSR
jgi:hypothetical protein